MKIKMELLKNDYISPVLEPRGNFVVLDRCDLPVFAETMYDGFLNTVDYEGETLSETIAFIEQTKAGLYGDVFNDFSGLLADDGKYVSGIIITLFENEPLIASAFTRREYKHKGYGEYILRYAIGEIFKNTDYKIVTLYVTDNNPAISLYKKIGFVETE